MSKDSHIFVCFSSKDETLARSVVEFLELNGFACWISVRDVPPGQNYQEAIVVALESAKGIVFLFSEASGSSGEIKKELSLAGALNLPVFPLRLAPVMPTGALRYELATRQWIDLFPDHERSMRRLVETVRSSFNANETSAAVTPADPTSPGPSATASATPMPYTKRNVVGHAPVVSPGSEEFEAVRTLLARYIGPIAKVFVQKAATEACSREDFCEQLAAHVRTPTDRAAFLQAARTQLSIR